MAKILSQEEVDALLNEFSEEETPSLQPLHERYTPPTTPAVVTRKKEKDKDRRVSNYNFRRPDRLSKEKLRSLHYLHDHFARNFSSSLSTYLRTLVDVNLYSVEQLSYAEFILSLSDPTYFNAITMNPLEGKAALEINPKILFPIIDKILGGKGDDLGGGIRSITDIERTLIEGVVKIVLRDLEISWKQIEKLHMFIAATETSPQLIQIVAPNEIVVLITFELKIGEAKGFMNFCIPSIMLEPISKRFSQNWYNSRIKTSVNVLKKIKMNLLKTDIKLETGIYGNAIAARDIIGLKPGDVLKLESKVIDPITIALNGIKKFNVYQVKHGKKKTVQVVDLIPREFKNE